MAHKPLVWKNLLAFGVICVCLELECDMVFAFFKSRGVLWSANTDTLARTTMIDIRQLFCMEGMWISDVLDLVAFFKVGLQN